MTYGKENQNIGIIRKIYNKIIKDKFQGRTEIIYL